MSCDTDDSETADSISVTKPPEIDGGSGDASNISSYTDTISTTNADHSDLELDALLNDAVKGFDSINKKSGKSSSSSSGVKLSSSGKKSTASVGTKAKTKQPKKKSDKETEGFERLLRGDMSGFDFEAEFKKLLSNEAVELGDLLALEFEKAMTDQSAQDPVLFGADVSNLREDPSGDKYEEQLLHKLDQLREDMGKHLKQSTPQQGGIGEAGEHYDVTEEIEKLMTGEGAGSIDELLPELLGTLLDKDILYPSIKELNEKYTPWLSKKGASLSEEELTRYGKQSDVIAQICKEYEKVQPEGESCVDGVDKTDAEVNSKSTEKIIELMHEMRELGNPPEELMSSIQPEGFPGLGDLPSLFPAFSPDGGSCGVM
ncbi:peroxisomal biogenesis factor 19-like isoform X1 [Convolutriloba macropyga]|uniref:peroxisomal biogenesis factor 19-like isoform X1 n=1 Tax=Convolutriloba macropyga TaxID=536237 RepID=UPI003F527B6D